jgi:hypothetical protein
LFERVFPQLFFSTLSLVMHQMENWKNQWHNSGTKSTDLAQFFV